MAPSHFAFSLAFLLGLTGVALNRAHLMSTLLCLEGMMLSLFISLSLWTFQLDSTNYAAAPMLMLALSACEASAGLALMVATARTHGTDHLQNLSLLQC